MVHEDSIALQDTGASQSASVSCSAIEPVNLFTNPFKCAEDFGNGPPPAAADVFMEGTLSKRVTGKTVEWIPKYVQIARGQVFLSNEKGGQPREVVSLMEIHTIQHSFAGLFLKPEGWAGLRDSVVRAGSKSKVEPEQDCGGVNFVAAKQENRSPSSRLEAQSAHLHKVEWENVMELYSDVQGRTYYLKAASAEACDAWLAALSQAKQKAIVDYEKSLNMTFWQQKRRQAAWFYENKYVQMAIAVLLLANFAVNIAQTEVEVHICPYLR